VHNFQGMGSGQDDRRFGIGKHALKLGDADPGSHSFEGLSSGGANLGLGIGKSPFGHMQGPLVTRNQAEDAHGIGTMGQVVAVCRSLQNIPRRGLGIVAETGRFRGIGCGRSCRGWAGDGWGGAF